SRSSLQGEHGRGVVGGRVGMGERAADRAAVAHLRVADPGGEAGEARNALAHHGRIGDLVVGGERADRQGIAIADLAEGVDRGERYQIRRLREIELHHGQQALAAREELGGVIAFEQRDRVGDRLRAMELEALHAAPPCAAWIARQTFSEVAGIVMSVTPSGVRASITALITAGGTPMAPTSPTPLMPIGLCVHAVTWLPTLKLGRSAARGMQ